MAFSVQGVRLIISESPKPNPNIKVDQREMFEIGGLFRLSALNEQPKESDPIYETLYCEIGDCSDYDLTVTITGHAIIRKGRIESAITNLMISLPMGLSTLALADYAERSRLRERERNESSADDHPC